MLKNEAPTENLTRIFEDNKRIEEGQQKINDFLEVNFKKGDIYLIALDIDGSMAVRKRGIEAKIYLVEQMKNLMSSLLEDNQILIDSGTRDEMYILYQENNSSNAINFANYLRKTVEETTFYMDRTQEETIQLTISVGVSHTPKYGNNSFDLIWSTKEALKVAKKERNAAHLLKELSFVEVTEYLSKDQREMLSLLSDYLQRDEESLIHEAIHRLFEKHSGVWHWGVDHWEYYNELNKSEA